MSIQQIRAALDSRLASYTPTLAIAWENAGYTPTAGTPWVQVQLYPKRPTPLGFGTGAPVRWTGTYRVTLMFPIDEGPGPAIDLAESLLAHFPRGMALTSDGVDVILEQPGLGAGMVRNAWYQLPLIVAWFATVG